MGKDELKELKKQEMKLREMKKILELKTGIAKQSAELQKLGEELHPTAKIRFRKNIRGLAKFVGKGIHEIIEAEAKEIKKQRALKAKKKAI